MALQRLVNCVWACRELIEPVAAFLKGLNLPDVAGGRDCSRDGGGGPPAAEDTAVSGGGEAETLADR
jgi:hypothetical protein